MPWLIIDSVKTAGRANANPVEAVSNNVAVGEIYFNHWWENLIAFLSAVSWDLCVYCQLLYSKGPFTQSIFSLHSDGTKSGPQTD